MAIVSIIFFTVLIVLTSSANNRFGSFAPSRSKCKAAWFVDGEDYMSAVADALVPKTFSKRSSRTISYGHCWDVYIEE